MAQSVQIQCVTKRPRYDPHERISYVGGLNDDGSRWLLGLDEAIAGVERGDWAFWTKGGGQRANVVVATHNGNKYLKTVADGLQPDNLLSLPDCP